MAWILTLAVLFASVLPCPAPSAQGAPPAGAHGHLHGSDEEAAHAASLRAPCHCGCENAPRADVSASRLPLALMLAGPAPRAPALVPLPDGRGAEAPGAPAPLVEHVPRHALA